jgi:hypothetical protein
MGTTAPPLTAEARTEVEGYFAAWWAVVRASQARGLPPATWKRMLPAPPVAALQSAALTHPDARVRRECLGVLDHEANDASVDVFRAALAADPVPRVRIVALHGLSCERCRVGELCAADVVPTLVDTLAHDPAVSGRFGVGHGSRKALRRRERRRAG